MVNTMLTRRTTVLGLSGLLATPAIVHASSLMRVAKPLALIEPAFLPIKGALARLMMTPANYLLDNPASATMLEFERLRDQRNVLVDVLMLSAGPRSATTIWSTTAS
jgi:hypothetical protein